MPAIILPEIILNDQQRTLEVYGLSLYVGWSDILDGTREQVARLLHQRPDISRIILNTQLNKWFLGRSQFEFIIVIDAHGTLHWSIDVPEKPVPSTRVERSLREQRLLNDETTRVLVNRAIVEGVTMATRDLVSHAVQSCHSSPPTVSISPSVVSASCTRSA